MHGRSKTITKKRGRVSLHLQAIAVGDDLCLILSGGDKPHIGAVALADPDTVHSAALPPHKEEELSRRLSLKITAAIGCNTAVVCGVHIDKITQTEIETVTELSMEMADKLIEELQPEEISTEESNPGDAPLVEIFSDGACSGNPGPGGYGTILRFGPHEKEFSGFDPETTNNRMEMLGAIAGLEQLKKPCKVRMTTDSQYLIKGMTEWINGWIKKGWKNSQRKDVANRELWERLVALVEPHQVEWVWVKGHAGHDENERCDELARNAIEDNRYS